MLSDELMTGVRAVRGVVVKYPEEPESGRSGVILPVENRMGDIAEGAPCSLTYGIKGILLLKVVSLLSS
jgi:hypothetical protein